MKSFGGRVLFLDRSDINTDEIIPARYLTEIEKVALKPHLLEDIKLEGSDLNREKLDNVGVIVTRENFGCGSSREHAPWALEVNGITIVIAVSFARIFRQNMFNCGMLAVELGKEDIDSIFSLSSHEPVNCAIDSKNSKLTFTAADNRQLFINYSVGGFNEALFSADGWVGYADARY